MPITGINLIYGIKFNAKELADSLNIDYKPNTSTSQLVNLLQIHIRAIAKNIYIYNLPCCFFDTSEENKNIYLGIQVDTFTYKYKYTGLDCENENEDTDFYLESAPKECSSDPSLVFTIDDINHITKTFDHLEDYSTYYSRALSTEIKIYISEQINHCIKLLNSIYYIFDYDYDELSDEQEQNIKSKAKFYGLPNGCTDC
jgi:hypothetical protein